MCFQVFLPQRCTTSRAGEKFRSLDQSSCGLVLFGLWIYPKSNLVDIYTMNSILWSIRYYAHAHEIKWIFLMSHFVVSFWCFADWIQIKRNSFCNISKDCQQKKRKEKKVEWLIGHEVLQIHNSIDSDFLFQIKQRWKMAPVLKGQQSKS